MGVVPELMDTAAVARCLGVSASRVRQMKGVPGFPERVDRLNGGDVWLAEQVRAFAAGRVVSRGGRPRKVAEAQRGE